MLGLSCILFGAGFPLNTALSKLLERLDADAAAWQVAFVGVMLRFVFGAFAVAVLLRFRLRQTTRSEWVQGFGLGAIIAAVLVLHLEAARHAPASTIAFLTQFYCVLVALASAWQARRRPRAGVWASLGVVLVGVALLSGIRPDELHIGTGELLALASSFVIAAQILWLSLRRFKGNDPTRLSWVMFLSAAVCLVPGCFGEGWTLTRAAVSDPATMGLAFVQGALISVGAFWMMNRFQPDVSATEAGLLYTTEPVYTAVLALFLPAILSALLGVAYANEALTANLIIGGVLVFAANVLLQLSIREKPREDSRPAARRTDRSETPDSR